MKQLFAAVVYLCLAGLVACTDRSVSPTVPEALDVGTPQTIFAATTRDPRPDGSFGVNRSEEYSLLELTVSIPPTHKPGDLKFGYGNPKPEEEFTMAARREFESTAAFNTRLQQELAEFPVNEREVTVFVHGFNSTQAETAFRAAQLRYDVELPGATVIYSWPSKGKPLAYAYDGDSVLFARDGLERLLHQLRSSGVRSIVLVAHSMGSQLVMETLRQIDIHSPGWSAANLSGVVLISPDLDVDVFRSQMNKLSEVPQPFLVFVSRKDNILTISQRLRGQDGRARLGNIENLDAVSDLPIEIVDTTAFADNAESGHFVAATSPALIAMLNSAQEASKSFERDALAIERILPGRVVIHDSATEISLAPPPSEAR